MVECENKIVSDQHERWEKIKKRTARELDEQYFADVNNLAIKSERIITEMCTIDNKEIPTMVRKHFVKIQREIMIRVVNRDKFEKVELLDNDFSTLLASTWSNILLSSKSRMKEEERQKQLTAFMNLFDFLNDKLEFLNTYKSFLASRLLSPSFSNLEDERKMLQHFKLKVSLSTTTAMEAMLRDTENAKKMNDIWISVVKRRKDIPPDASALRVLTVSQSSWPSNTLVCKTATKMPEKVSNWIQMYRKSNAMNHDQLAGARFVVCKGLGNVLMSLKYGNKIQYRVRMCPSQASLILLLKREGKLPFTEIQNKLEIKSDQVVANLLLSVLRKPVKTCTGGLVRKILSKGQKPLPLKSDDKFVLNMKFRSKNVGFVLPKVSDRKHGGNFVEGPSTQDAKMRRRIQLEFAMIRILKAHKELSVKEVILETTRSVSRYFRADPKEVKRAIEIMQKRKYFEVKGSTVRYLA